MEGKKVLNELALFAGGGGGILGSILLGWRTVCAVEIDPYCIESLLRRQADGCLPTFPIWDDVRTFDGRPWNGCVDVISGGFPCQDISCANQNRSGITGSRSSLFFEMLRIIEEVRPRFVIAENAKELRTNGLGAVVTGLGRLGYVGQVGVLGARHVGANHYRRRMWIVASDSNRKRKRTKPVNAEMARTQANAGFAEKSADSIGFGNGSRRRRSRIEASTVADVAYKIRRGNENRAPANSNGSTIRQQQGRRNGTQWEAEKVTRITDWWDIPRFAGMDDGGPNRMERVRATGNMQVPAVVALAWEILGQ
jgi:DNA (cytosine-5)-methyltransferase 1